MSEQDLQAIFEEMKTASGEERTRLKQKYYLTLYGSSSQQLNKFWETYRKRFNSVVTSGDSCD